MWIFSLNLSLLYQIRPCDIYYDEYDDCMSMKGRFHQYFIFGEPIDCNQWEKDYDNCKKWKKSQDVKAMVLDLYKKIYPRNFKINESYNINFYYFFRKK